MIKRLLLSAVLGLLAIQAPAQQPNPAATAATAAPVTLDAILAQLPDADFDAKHDLVTALAADGSPTARRVLAAMLDGRLFYRLADKQIVSVADADADPLAITDIRSNKPLGQAAAGDFDRVTTNNGLRKELRGALAGLELNDPDRAVRLAAVKEMLRSIDADSAELLRPRLDKEKDAGVLREIRQAVAMVDLTSDSADSRLAAVTTLKGSLNPDVFNLLQAIATPNADGSYTEKDPRVLAAAQQAVRRIETRRHFYSTIETLFFGLSLGSVLVLAGFGLAITFGVMGVINMAHGELMMLGAYCVYVVQQLMPHAMGASILVAIPVAFVVSGLVGILIERGIVRFLYGRPLETLLATFGVSLILQQVVRDVFSPNNRPVETPAWMAGSLQVNDLLQITLVRIYIVLFAVLVFIALQLVLKRTSLGLHVRAVSQNRAMARAMGIRTDWVDALTFGLGAGIAGVAGVALSQLTNVGPNLGQNYIVDSFMVVVFGGVGNLWGTMISGLSLGVANKLLEPLAGAVLAKIFVLVALILFIQRRPRGLFPQKGRSAET
ncbi:MAG TPA: urea ABC transporter permease subunit UrtB [Steroidobacteraceae bacterium]|nr:urea ABC transporter permease subunit UrtB [Steroidobacteraceae bacterium]